MITEPRGGGGLLQVVQVNLVEAQLDPGGLDRAWRSVERPRAPNIVARKGRVPRLLGGRVHVTHKLSPQLLPEATPDPHVLPDPPKAQLSESIRADCPPLAALPHGTVFAGMMCMGALFTRRDCDVEMYEKMRDMK